MRDIFLPFPNLRAKTLAGRNFGVLEKMLNFSQKIMAFGELWNKFHGKNFDKYTEKACFRVKKA